MVVAHDEATMELIKTRLSHSERPLIRLMRSFYKLTMISTGTVEDERTAEELKIAHMNFLLDLRQLVRTLKELKGTRAVELNRSESLQLEIERVRLEEQALDEKLKIKNLESQLDQARRDRKNKMQYEEIGKEVRRFSDRFQSADRINGLAREIESLLEEQGFYAERWASRRAQFDTVISNLEVLQESIKEEKADADRKKALNDDESDDGNIAEEGAEATTATKPVGAEEIETSMDGQEETPTQVGSQLQAPGPISNNGLNPHAASFVPPTGEPQHLQRMSDASDDKMKIDGEPENLNQNASQGTHNSSELVMKPDQHAMEIDGFEPQTSHSVEGSNEDGLVIEEATMEDGEEIEEAEEGEEMEDQA